MTIASAPNERSAAPICFSVWFGALLGALFLLNAIHAWRLPVWGRNELAHFDRLERLSSLEWPRGAEPISDAAFEATLRHDLAWKRPKNFDGTKAGMGADGVSYETHQPPLYYLLMAPANAALRAAGVAIPSRVRSLRVAQLAFAALAIAFLFAICRELERSCGVARSWAWPMALAAATFHVPLTGTLGNDALSLAAGNATLWLCLRGWRIGEAKSLALAGFAVGAAFLSKPTCLLLLPCWGLAWLAAGARTNRLHDSRWFALCAAPVAIPLAWLAANGVLLDDATGTAATLSRFERAPIDGLGRFLRALLGNAFSARHLGWIQPAWLLEFALPLLAFANIAAGFATWRPRPGAAPVEGDGSAADPRAAYDRLILFRRLAAFCALLFFATLAAAHALNLAKPQVLWSGFRHYLAIATLCCVALFSMPFGFNERARAATQAALAALFSLAAASWAWRLAGVTATRLPARAPSGRQGKRRGNRRLSRAVPAPNNCD
jgi:hypothetical protein